MEIVLANRDLALASHGHACFSVVRGNTSSEALACLRETTARVMKAHPNKHFLVNIVESTAAKPTPEQRKSFAETLKSASESTNMTTLFVFEATGFGAAAVRAVIAGISFLSGKSQKTFGSLDEAIAFMTEGEPPSAGRDAFARGVRDTVAEMKKRITEAQ